MWNEFVDVIRATIFGASHAFGGSIGGGILLVSFAVRLSLLPWTLRIARRAIIQQRKIAQLAPQIARIRKRWEKEPARLMEATQQLYQQNGIKLFDPASFFGMMAQWPLFAGLFAAVRSGLGAKSRFLWIADLSAGNPALALLVAGMSAGAAALMPSTSASTSAQTGWIVLAGAMTLVFAWSTSSALALSIGSGSAVSALQNWLLRRELARTR